MVAGSRIRIAGMSDSKAEDIVPIKTRRDHGRALREIEDLMDARHGTRRGKRLDALVTLVEAWEAKQFPLTSMHARRR